MIRFLLCFALATFPMSLTAHEMLPTYPEFKNSYMDGLYVTTMRMFNKRDDVDFYEIGVFDNEWNPIPFATNSAVLKIPYLSKAQFDIYIRAQDINKVTYICSTSKIKKDTQIRTAIKTKICSKVK